MRRRRSRSYTRGSLMARSSVISAVCRRPAHAAPPAHSSAGRSCTAPLKACWQAFGPGQFHSVVPQQMWQRPPRCLESRHGADRDLPLTSPLTKGAVLRPAQNGGCRYCCNHNPLTSPFSKGDCGGFAPGAKRGLLLCGHGARRGFCQCGSGLRAATRNFSIGVRVIWRDPRRLAGLQAVPSNMEAPPTLGRSI
jgi:hypothetical protein